MMDSLDNLFESIYKKANNSRGQSYIKNSFGEKWKKVSHTSKVFKDFNKVVKHNYNLKSKITLLDVAKVEGKDYYIAELQGGLNGSGKWIDYFNNLEKLLKEYTGKAWLVDIENDCTDDVFYLRLAFEN